MALGDRLLSLYYVFVASLARPLTNGLGCFYEKLTLFSEVFPESTTDPLPDVFGGADSFFNAFKLSLGTPSGLL